MASSVGYTWVGEERASKSVRSPDVVAWGMAVAKGDAMAEVGSGGGGRR